MHAGAGVLNGIGMVDHIQKLCNFGRQNDVCFENADVNVRPKLTIARIFPPRAAQAFKILRCIYIQQDAWIIHEDLCDRDLRVKQRALKTIDTVVALQVGHEAAVDHDWMTGRAFADRADDASTGLRHRVQG